MIKSAGAPVSESSPSQTSGPGIPRQLAVAASPVSFGHAELLRFLAAKALGGLDAAQRLAVERSALDHAQNLAGTAALHAQSLALLADDYNVDLPPEAGAFQSHGEVPALLFHFAHLFSQVEGLLQVAAVAATEAA